MPVALGAESLPQSGGRLSSPERILAYLVAPVTQSLGGCIQAVCADESGGLLALLPYNDSPSHYPASDGSAGASSSAIVFWI